MSSQPIAPVIPSLSRPAVRAGGRAGQGRRLPLATVAEVPALASDVLYRAGRIDASGRVGDRAFTSALGWRPGDRLTLTAADGVVLARRDPTGLVTMPAKPYVVIPSALRRRCGLLPGDRVLLAMFPGQDAMAAYSFAVVYVPVVSAAVTAGLTARTGTGSSSTGVTGASTSPPRPTSGS